MTVLPAEIISGYIVNEELSLEIDISGGFLEISFNILISPWLARPSSKRMLQRCNNIISSSMIRNMRGIT